MTDTRTGNATMRLFRVRNSSSGMWIRHENEAAAADFFLAHSATRNPDTVTVVEHEPSIAKGWNLLPPVPGIGSIRLLPSSRRWHLHTP